VINELTTVMSAICFAHDFQLDRRNFSWPSVFVNPGTGKPQPVLSEAPNSPALVNTLADILAGCVRSSGPTASPCARLVTASPGSPNDTLEAAQSIASYPV